MRFLVTVLLLTGSAFSKGQSVPSGKEMRMIDEINLVRTNPGGYCNYIREYLTYWEAEDSVVQIANELIDTLQKMEPLGALEYKEELYQAAVNHGKWMLENDLFEHSDFQYAENLVAGDSLARYAVVSLLIDDGVPDRGHRWILLDPTFIYVACYYVPAAIEGVEYIFVQEFD